MALVEAGLTAVNSAKREVASVPQAFLEALQNRET
jgi:hypothetical protein